MTVDALPRIAVDDVAKHLSVAIDDVAFAHEVFVLGMDVERVGQGLLGTKLAAQIFVVHLEP